MKGGRRVQIERLIENLLDEDYEDVYGYSTPGIGGFVGVRMGFDR